jgi:hypothetical protein
MQGDGWHRSTWKAVVERQTDRKWIAGITPPPDAEGGAKITGRTSPVSRCPQRGQNPRRIPPIHFLRERLTEFRASPAINLPSRQNPAPYEEYGRHRSSQAGQEKIPREKEHREEDTNQRKGSNDRASTVVP